MTDFKQWFRNIDYLLILLVMGLIGISLTVLYSIGSGAEAAGIYAKKQLIWVIAGLGLMALTGVLNYARLKHYTLFLYGFNLGSLLTIFFVGKTALGAQRWIEFGFFRFQPSEFSKLSIIITVAAFLAEKKGEFDGWRDIFLAGAHAAPIVLLILLQPDLGTALVIMAILGGMFLVAGIKNNQMALLGLAGYGVVGLVFKLRLLHDYQMKRLVVFMNPEIDPLGSGYNLRQSIIAIGSGGILGKGLFSGTQSRLNFLPEAVRHTDFIFAVIGEELGFVGGAVVICLVFFLLARTLRIASLSRNHFGLLIAAGIASMWIFQVLVNVGMTIGIMPVTGIPLPFVSYGGSSLLMNMVAVGLLLSIYGRRWS